MSPPWAAIPFSPKRCPSWRPCWRFRFGRLWPLGGAFSAGSTGSWSPPLSLSRGPGLWVDCGPPPWPPCSCWGEPGRGSSWVWLPAACWPVGAYGTRTGTPSTGRGKPACPGTGSPGGLPWGATWSGICCPIRTTWSTPGSCGAWPGCCPCSSGRLRGCGWPRWGLPCSPLTPPWESCCPAIPALNRPSVFCRGKGGPSAFPMVCSSAPAIWLRRGSFWAVGSFKWAGFPAPCWLPPSSLPWKAPS